MQAMTNYEKQKLFIQDFPAWVIHFFFFFQINQKGKASTVNIND